MKRHPIIEDEVGPGRPLGERGGGLLNILQNGVGGLGDWVMGRGEEEGGRSLENATFREKTTNLPRERTPVPLRLLPLFGPLYPIGGPPSSHLQGVRGHVASHLWGIFYGIQIHWSCGRRRKSSR